MELYKDHGESISKILENIIPVVPKISKFHHVFSLIVEIKQITLWFIASINLFHFIFLKDKNYNRKR